MIWLEWSWFYLSMWGEVRQIRIFHLPYYNIGFKDGDVAQELISVLPEKQEWHELFSVLLAWWGYNFWAASSHFVTTSEEPANIAKTGENGIKRWRNAAWIYLYLKLLPGLLNCTISSTRQQVPAPLKIIRHKLKESFNFSILHFLML